MNWVNSVGIHSVIDRRKHFFNGISTVASYLIIFFLPVPDVDLFFIPALDCTRSFFLLSKIKYISISFQVLKMSFISLATGNTLCVI